MITKEQADLIVKNNEAFKRKDETINGRNVCQYTYLLASYNDFLKPIEGSDLTAYELRGLTFVETDTGWERTLFLNKFFNINQVEETLLHNIKDKKIKRIATKEDGSAIGFVKIDNKVYGKTKFSFQSEQAVAATKIYEKNEAIKSLVDDCLKNNYSPLFEFVSPFNKIVLPYQDENLILLQVRDNNTGEFIDIYNDLDYNGSKAPFIPIEDLTIESILEDFETREGIEGYIITFEDGMMVKAKTKWYFELHHLITEGVDKENFIIQHVLEETIDDILSELPPEQVLEREFVNDVTDVIVKYINHNANIVLEKAKTFNGDRKAFVEENKTYELFPILMKVITDPTIETAEKLLSNYIAKKTYKLENARAFLRNLGYERKLKLSISE
jgi:T4 RnlA family RNA ligase